MSRSALLARARSLEGLILAELAAEHGLVVPADLHGHKGWIGQLLERALGATAGSRGEPDFPELGVELKTVPVDDAGRPRESTWVCAAPRDGRLARQWEDSRVHAKLATVLWVPIAGSDAPGRRRVGRAVLWSPSADQEQRLREDWEALAERLDLGVPVTAHVGDALQVRPKGASASDFVWTLDAEGEWVQAVPRGFYLRRSFTTAVLRERDPAVTTAGSLASSHTHTP